jgi:hypothetical protein
MKKLLHAISDHISYFFQHWARVIEEDKDYDFYGNDDEYDY